MSNITPKDQEALDYHQFPRPGKISVEITKPISTQKDLSLAYTPGVAVPCLAIEKNPEDAYKYTAKSNLVAVISNGTAVLGLGNIGALASKPVMEGKGVLFKAFSGLDSFDIEVDSEDVDRFCSVVSAIAPTFGGINLEDIKAPECFEIERRLVEALDIPVMHDDQHGTAVISTAAIINACLITEKKLEDLKIVVVGAGAAAISCARLYKHAGAKSIYMMDSKGIIHDGRDDLNEYKREFSAKGDMSNAEIFQDADVVVGLSKPGSFGIEDIKLMAAKPIIFTLANPTPEIAPDDVRAARPDAIIATGRSDFANQVNNVLGFPFIFRGAMDVRAKKINIEMKVAAANALAKLAQEEVPSYIHTIYGKELSFGEGYIIPSPFDKRLVVEVSSAVAQAAIDTGSSTMKDFDMQAYRAELATRIK
ncbi:MAG: malate dehydrogenase [Epsilonproteobacteria bacterium]|nr:malate dehydrogenase [Campylobacterota bacterium]OIO16330.1 MAG: malate dehydrogenase [Helicobacteraceae bacterium CG1_02_36_14]PIP09528.1 MAG: malate dehydrogenase [Sulfurimonas sp. CG23_combo_of_CG06-09_8_20_14_all_36_33]PIS24873.1 MAG: malate dehydrogenase [Sulfurimonas sp. CG08_land_8_20_14_0_20_36_33]PIU33598.1 MAG: malate dehydrogenase [Sulfurimonas sp. CG07_land_8_20_14_0_80_36_56]PIV05559.1 MAG: malate dehydrogenase [Sulfurimonas sp. CG03_land_8_20_14_0_80_36_25]PIV34788.1 MAG: mal